MSDTQDTLIERLREESQRLSGYSLDRGSVDAGIASNLADEAATALADRDAKIAELEKKAMTYWRSIDTAPEDQHVILATSGDHVGEAIMLTDEDTGQQKWAWALGPLHPNHTPYGWQPLPSSLSAPVLSDLRDGGFDGPTGAE